MFSKVRTPGAGVRVAVLAVSSLLLVSGVAVSVHAEDPDSQYLHGQGTKIVVSGDAVDGRGFTAYKLADYLVKEYSESPQTEGTVVVGFELGTLAGSDDLRAEVASYVGGQDADAVVSGGLVDGLDPLQYVAQVWRASSGADSWGNLMSDHPKVRGLADHLQGWFETHATETPVVATGSGGEAVLDTSEGLWLVVDTTLDDDEVASATVSSALVVGTQFEYTYDIDKTAWSDLYTSSDAGAAFRQNLGSVFVKGDAIDVTKTTDAANGVFAAIGDTVAFTVDAVVPSFANYKLPEAGGSGYGSWENPELDAVFPVLYQVSDRYGQYFEDPASSGLFLDVYVGEGVVPLTRLGVFTDGELPSVADVATGAAGYFLTLDDDENRFVVTLSDAQARAFDGSRVQVRYSLVLGQDVTAASPVDGVQVSTGHNEASVTFSNDPSSNVSVRDDDVPTDETAHYSFPLTLDVADMTDRTQKLSGVSFSFQDVSGDGEYLVFDPATGKVTGKDDGTGPDGVPCTPASNSLGVLELDGLAGDVLYAVKQCVTAQYYTDANLPIVQFKLYIDAEIDTSDTENKLGGVGYFFYNDGTVTGVDTGDADDPGNNQIFDVDKNDGSAVTAPVDEGTDLSLAQPLSLYLFPVVYAQGTDTSRVLVLNAKTTADMPFTGGSILLYLGVTALVGVAGAVFAVVAVRRRRRDGAPVVA
jgi:hypothetical protein